MNKHRSFYSNLVLLIILNLLIKPLWIFGIDRLVQNQTGTEAYGSYFAVLSLCSVLGFLCDWGLTSYFNRELAAENRALQLGSMLGLKLGMVLIYAAVVLLVALLSGLHHPTLVLELIAVQILNSFFLFFRAIITAEQWFQTDAWLSVLDKTLLIVFCGYFILAGTISIRLFVLLQILTTAIAVLIVLFILLRRKYQFAVRSPFRTPVFIFKQAWPYALIILLMSTHNRLDAFLLERMRNDGGHQAGLYAASYRLLDACNMAGYLLASFLLPYIARHFSRSESYTEPVLQARHILIPFSIWVAALAFFKAESLQTILYPKTGAELWPVLRRTLPALIGYSFTQIYGTVLTATERIGLFLRIVAASLLINIVLNLMLIPAQGAAGSATAAVVSQTFCGIACWYACSHPSGLQPGYRSLAGYAVAALGLTLYFYSTRNLNWPLPLTIILSGVWVLLVLISGGWLRIRSLFALKN